MSNHAHDEGELHFEQIQHHGVQYEDRDLGGRAIIAFLVVLVVVTAMLCLGVWGYFEYRIMPAYQHPAAHGQPEVKDLSNTFVPPEKRFPQPALQTDDVADMDHYRQESAQHLNGYGYSDAKSGVVYIPIDQAMEQIAKQGLPTRPAPSGQPPVADFGSGEDTVAGAAGGTRPEVRQ
jgi:hypothetical protein